MDKAFSGLRARKFSIDVPRLKIGPNRADNRDLKKHINQLHFEPESPPQTPRSVRPPLPQDIEADLRNACAVVLHGFKPTEQTWQEQYGNKPQLDYSAIKQAPRKQVEGNGAPLSKEVSNNEGGPTAQELRAAAEAKFRESERKRQQRQSQAVTRSDELMAGPSKMPDVPGRDRSDSQHNRSKSTPYTVPALVAPMPDFAARPKSVMRTASTGTTGSTPQTDSAEYPWSASTALTSATGTPAKDSKRTSAQAVHASAEAVLVTKASMVELRNAHKDPETKDAGKSEIPTPSNSVPVPAVSGERSDSKILTPPTESTTPVAKVPNRKPVPASTDTSRPPTRQAPAPVLTRGYSTDGTSVTSDPPASAVSRSQSRSGRRKTKLFEPGSLQRAASRARSVTRDVKDYMRSASRSRQAPPMPESGGQSALRRSESRSRQVSSQVKDYVRSASRAVSRKQSMDIGRGHGRSPSQDSFVSARSKAETHFDGGRSRSRREPSKPFYRAKTNASNTDLSNGSDRPSSRGRGADREAVAGASHDQANVNLNRELPPLPGLDKWKDQEAEPSQSGKASATSSPVRSAAPTLKPAKPSVGNMRENPMSADDFATSRDTAQHAPKESVDDVLAARMGAPVSAAAIAKKPTGLRKSNTDNPPPVPAHAPPSVPATSATIRHINDFEYSHGYASSPTDPRGESAIKVDRRRSKSALEVYLPTRPVKAHTDNPAVAFSGRAQLVNAPRSNSQSRSTGFGRSMSTRQGPPAPPVQVRNIATSANTPLQHSRDNSDHHVPIYTAHAKGDRAGQRPEANRTMSEQSDQAVAGVQKKKWWRFKGGNNGVLKRVGDRNVRPQQDMGSDDSAASPVIRY
nr:hypothetical protein B0A51_13695 [Rachicladosporium sp. CCFEE 5018]OQO24511.1 hypothetical protein B0A51_09542 [Rachicladosporium sp. CCFEE 5018]